VTLRRRLTLITTLIVGAIVIAAAAACYLVIRGELRGQVDLALTSQGLLLDRFDRGGPGRGRGGFRGRVPELGARQGGPTPFVTVLAGSGRVFVYRGDAAIPVTERDRRIAAGTDSAALDDRDAAGLHLRTLTAPLPGGGALILGRSLADVDRTLERLRLVLAILCLAGIALAALLARRTADRFVAVLDRLERSQAAQRQLVADASHELRTPVTALRTNAEILLDEQGLPPAQRRALLADVVDQTEELGALVADLIELARGDRPAEEVEDVRLDELVEEAVERARRHATHVAFSTSLDRVAVDGVRERLGRAVNNLLDNAAKYSPPGGTVEVTLRGGELTVRDHGPGVPPDELPQIFDRFFRASNARDRPGSGLGLAIVKQVAERHGGSVRAAAADGGGLAVTLSLPRARAVPWVADAAVSPPGPARR
jgi:two-component system sensor histidine kinase MprB